MEHNLSCFKFITNNVIVVEVSDFSLFTITSMVTNHKQPQAIFAMTLELRC